MKSIWPLLSALFVVLSALCLPPISSFLAIPPRRGMRPYSPPFPVILARLMESVKEKPQSL
jgi:hypothetical protein